MSNYGVNINFKVVGQNKVDRAITSAKKLEASISRIRSIDLSKAVGGASGDRIANALSQLRRYAQQVNKLGKTIGDTPAQQQAAANAFKEVADNAKVGSFTFEEFTKAAFKQSEGLKASEKAAENVIRRMKGMQTVEQRDAQLQRRAIKLRELRAKRERELAAAENQRRNRATVRNAASSAIIGGAFPLLFGQTGAAAVGGGLGGAAGGLIGGQFGFALSILGTAIGSFIQQQDELDKSLSKISRSFENAGNSAGFTRESFNKMKSILRMTKDEVLAVATEFAKFGEAGESAAFIFGDNPNTFKNLAAVRDTKTLMTAILDTQNGLSIKQQIQLLTEAKVTSFKDMQLKLNRMILEENMRREIIEARQITRQEKIADVFKSQLRLIMLIKSFGTMDLEKAFPDFFKTSAEKAEENVQKIQEEFKELMVELPELQDLLTELDTQVQGMSNSIPSAIDSVSKELEKLMSVGFMVTTTADTIGKAFGESFKGIVKGSMTAQQALANLFQRTADAFLDMAAQIIAKQIQMQILGIGLKFVGAGVGGSVGGQVIDSNAVPLVDPLTGIGTAANGGPIPGGKPTLVGEKGPELFTPGVSGNITPNHALGGTTNVVVNVDASGSSVQGDDQSANQLGELIAAAVQSEIVNQKMDGGLLS